ncbi:MAG: sigma-70 family RNA polymerase sigma factor [Paludibacter sp.]|jgi:RNA polymerase sigma-70 factor (ECF subfamily)|nr:sigma-70 family RNA polymerase sigma factor [Paludibacter sp.]
MALFKKNHTTKTDEELMSLLTKGGQSAFDELYSRYSKPLLNFFFRMLNSDREKAEDLLHDLFLKVIEKPEIFDGNKKFNTWFYTLASNMIKNEYRSRQIRSEHVKQSLANGNNLFEMNSERLDKELFNSQLQRELEKLDVDAQTIFNLRFVEEMNIKQIAEIMDCPEGTVKSRLFYLTRLLSKKLSVYKPELN